MRTDWLRDLKSHPLIVISNQTTAFCTVIVWELETLRTYLDKHDTSNKTDYRILYGISPIVQRVLNIFSMLENPKLTNFITIQKLTNLKVW